MVVVLTAAAGWPQITMTVMATTGTVAGEGAAAVEVVDALCIR